MNTVHICDQTGTGFCGIKLNPAEKLAAPAYDKLEREGHLCYECAEKLRGHKIVYRNAGVFESAPVSIIAIAEHDLKSIQELRGLLTQETLQL